MASKALPSPEVLRQLLRYEPDTGRLFWLPRPKHLFAGKSVVGRHSAAHNQAAWNARYAGKQAFTTAGSDGYLYGHINKISVAAHRVIWAMMTGEWPGDEIDHRDTNRANNRFQNLRPATSAQNKHNTKTRATNTSGAKGVRQHPKTKRWRAEVGAGGKNVHIGYFATKEAAIAARDKAGRALHGEFYRGK